MGCSRSESLVVCMVSLNRDFRLWGCVSAATDAAANCKSVARLTIREVDQKEPTPSVL